jgi:hypothetical protein
MARANLMLACDGLASVYILPLALWLRPLTRGALVNPARSSQPGGVSHCPNFKPRCPN